jgi:hypothetical protein
MGKKQSKNIEEAQTVIAQDKCTLPPLFGI